MGVGGQDHAINPALARAAAAVFVFKQRIGSGAWSELTACRNRPDGERIPIIALFPSEGPLLIHNNAKAAAEWADLLGKKEELTENWMSPYSRAVTPVEQYRDHDHLKDILHNSIERILPLVTRHKADSSGKPQPDMQSPETSHPTFDFDGVTNEFEFDVRVVQQYRESMRPQLRLDYPPELSDSDFLQKSNYLQDGRLTVAGLLLFSQKSLKVFPSAYTSCSKYLGTDKTKKTIDRTKLTGPLLNQLSQARDYIEAHTGSAERPTEISQIPEKVHEYPMICIREIIANAICHRDYADRERGILVDIYTDRIEILSPGCWVGRQLPADTTVLLRNLASYPAQRNMRLAHAISSVAMMEMLGSGIQTAVRDCEESRAEAPHVIEKDGYVVVKVYPGQRWHEESRTLEINLPKSPGSQRVLDGARKETLTSRFQLIGTPQLFLALSAELHSFNAQHPTPLFRHYRV
ncbi:MAG: hypothetical protein EXR78_06980 [Deltaproteobacteria bacterium]|nr:hypothetical protein [Deltaproteobacteria bacterium]